MKYWKYRLRGIVLLSILALFAGTAQAQQDTGTITANGGVVVFSPSSTTNSITITITGTWAATLAFEYLPYNTTTYAALTCTNTTSFATATGATSNSNWACLNVNLTQVRVRASAYTSGTAVIAFKGTSNGTLTGLIFGGGSGGTIGTVNQGTASATEQWLVNCVTGCSGGTSDTDDATISSGQVTGLSLGLTQVFDGTNWKRFTVGVAGTSSTQVVSVQGIASGTALPISVASIPTHAVTQSGTWNIGTVTTVTAVTSLTNALPAGTNNIGDVDVLSIAAGDNNIGNVDIASATGNFTVVQGTGTNLHMVCDSGCSSSTAPADNSAFTAGTTSSSPVSGLYESSPSSLTSGRIGAVGLSATRAIRATLESAAGVPWVPSTDYIHDTALGTITAVTGPASLARASAAAPSDVSADGDAVLPWHLRNGSAVTNLAVGGTLITATSTSINVACTAGCGGSGGASQADNSTVTDINAGGYLFDTTIPTITDGNVGLAVMDSARRQIVAGAGTAGTAAGGVLTIQGVASMTPVLATLTGTNNIATVTTVTAVTAISNALPAGNNNIGDVDIASLPAVTNAGTFVTQIDGAALAALQLMDNAETAATGFRFTSAGTTEDEHAVTASPATLWSILATNHTATGVFLRCENDTAANTAPGSETPELDIEIPGATTGAGFLIPFPRGMAFSTAITCWVVTGEADTDVAEVGANDVKLLYTFKN